MTTEFTPIKCGECCGYFVLIRGALDYLGRSLFGCADCGKIINSSDIKQHPGELWTIDANGVLGYVTEEDDES